MLCEFQRKISECKRCPRLIAWAGSRKGEKKEHNDSYYWGKPVPGFGDPKAELIVVGLAPGAHGANRTGRPFTGDVAGIYLYKSLHTFGFSSLPQAISRDDGLKLQNVYITNAVRCAPPDNKPTSAEFNSCRSHLREELSLLSEKKVILTLGGNAFNQVKRLYKELGVNTSGVRFVHGQVYSLDPSLPHIVGCYHTSQYNINTNRMSQEQLDEVFSAIMNILQPRMP